MHENIRKHISAVWQCFIRSSKVSKKKYLSSVTAVFEDPVSSAGNVPASLKSFTYLSAGPTYNKAWYCLTFVAEFSVETGIDINDCLEKLSVATVEFSLWHIIWRGNWCCFTLSGCFWNLGSCVFWWKAEPGHFETVTSDIGRWTLTTWKQNQ